MAKAIHVDNRLKVLGLQCLVFVLVSVALYTASAYFVQGEFSKIEVRDTQKDTAVAVDTVDNQVDDLSVKTSDWSQWDDTYKYIVDHNQAYVDANIAPSWLVSLRINYMLFYDLKHQLVRAIGIDDNGNEVQVPRELLAYFGVNSILFCDNEKDLHKGFINLPANPLMFAARPILTSNHTGPSHGTLVFAENLSSSQTQQIATLTHINLGYYRLSELPADVRLVPRIDTAIASTQVLSQSQIAGYRMVNDIFGKPLLVARVIDPRDVFVEAQQSLRYFVISIALVTLVAIFIAQYIANQVRARDNTIQLKNEFFSIASHEIRTPLSAIKGNSALLAQVYGTKNDADFSVIVKDIHESSNRLIRLVTNYLDVARLEQGNIPLSITSLDLPAVAKSVIEEMQGLAADHKIYIRSGIDGQIPLVRGDADRVKQVIYNLIGNAAKFTESGGITVNAEVQGAMVKVGITDTGRGIPPESQKLLFRKFQQTRDEDGASGTGLGLYISKMLVNLMGGEIRLDSSQVGKGTTISFTIPTAPPNPPGSPADQAGR